MFEILADLADSKTPQGIVAEVLLKVKEIPLELVTLSFLEDVQIQVRR